MDIFGEDREQRLKKFKSAELLFTEMENSTCTAEGLLKNVDYNEEDIIDYLNCTGKIVKIDSNYGHLRAENYGNAPEVKKSKRGRKKKPKPKKVRKYQGDGSGFNSQTTFSILGTHIRKIPNVPDKHTKTSIKLPNGYESVTKEYKVKLFRNGKITTPGILTETMVDIKAPLDELCQYLSNVFIEDVKVVDLFSVMRNYKFHLHSGKIDIKRLQQHCEKYFHHLLNTRFSDIVEFLTNPILSDSISPRQDGWNNYSEDGTGPTTVNLVEMKKFLQESRNVKNLYVDFAKLSKKIQDADLSRYYNKITDLAEVSYYSVSDEVLQLVLQYWMIDELKDLEKFLTKSKDNLLSHIKYDPEKYPGFLIKVKTPNMRSKDKKTTIKIFPSGKINIDGANSREEAEYIYYWLNYLFATNSQIIYHPDQLDDDEDSEFSSDSESDD
jgi:hypothetical protein